MINLFKRKERSPGFRDKIVMTEEAKWKALSSLCEKDKNIILISWFDGTLKNTQAIFSNASDWTERCILANQVHSSQTDGKKVVMAEHYPLQQKEKDLFDRLHLSGVEIWSALDEPLFKEFGSDKIVKMMKQLGMKEDEVIEHSMISDAITNAQKKIWERLVTDQAAASQEEWLHLNLKAS